MKKIILLLVLGMLCCTSPDQAWSKAYYMRADGMASNKADATSCSSTSTAMSVSTHNKSTFSPGDVIYLCSNGGQYKENIVAPSSGALRHPITYTNAPGHTPVCDNTGTISDHSVTGWSEMGGGVYRSRGYGQVLFEDDIALPKASSSACIDGYWYYDTVKKPFIIYYKPTRGTPADHKVERLWADSLNSRRGIDLADRSNVTVYGLTFDRCGVGIYFGQDLQSTGLKVSNIIIRNNKVTRSYWGIWGRYYKDGIISDVRIYDNVVDYSSYGIGSWLARPAGTRTAGHNTRFVITRNRVLNLDSASDSISWNQAFGSHDNDRIDHEGISFQDVQDSEISYNYIKAKVPVRGMSPRGIFLYGSYGTTAKMSGNSILYNKLEGAFQVGIYVCCDSAGGWDYAGFENNLIAYNVMVGDADPYHVHSSFCSKFSKYNPATGTNYFINNTIWNSDKSGAWGISMSATSGTWVIRNNIIKAGRNFALGSAGNPTPTPRTFTIDHNIYATNTYFILNDLTTSLAKWMAAGYDAVGSKLIDPLLNSDGTLTSSSPAIGTGLNLGSAYAGGVSPKSAWPESVLIVNQNKNGRGWEIGAFVYH
jgi:hypothetical protein